MTWKESLIGIPLAALGGALLLITGAGMTATRTDWGREKVRQSALDRLNSAIQGHVEIGGVLQGDLLRRIGLTAVEVYEPDGRLFATIDTVIVDYRWWDFLTGNVVLPKVTLVGPVVRVEVSREGAWNAIEIFRGRGAGAGTDRPPGPEPTGPGPRIELREVAIRSGDVTLSMAWDPTDGSDVEDTRWHVEERNGELRRVFRLERLNANLPVARVAVPRQRNRLLQIGLLNGKATIIGEPFEIDQLRADLEFRGDTLAFDLWEGDLPGSHLFGQGWVTLGGELAYDFTLRGNPVTTQDLLWLMPSLPAGTAQLDYSMRSLPNGIALEAQNATWESRDAVVSGRFALKLTDGVERFELDSVDLAVTRLHTRAIESLTGWEPPVEGELSGHVAVDGTRSELTVDADVRILPEGWAVPSRMTAVGVVHARRGNLGAHDLEVQFDTLDLDLVRAVLPGFAPNGRVTGRGRADGLLAEGLAVEFAVEQRDGDLAPTRLSGGGTVLVDTAGPARLDLSVGAEQLSLNTLAVYYPAIPFRGSFRGEVDAVGPLDALDVEARLLGGSDSLRLEGELRLGGATPGYRAEMQGWRMRLARLREALPESDLDFRAEFEGEGVGLEDLRATGRLDIYSSFVGGVRFDTAHAELRIADGRLFVDTAAIETEFGAIHLAGGLGLRPGVVDSLRFQFAGDSLQALTPWLAPALGPLAPTALSEDPGGRVEAEVPVPRLEGSARVAGLAIGNLEHVAIRAAMEGQRVRYGNWRADELRVTQLEIADIRGSLSLSGAVVAMGAGPGRFRFDEVSARGAASDRLATVDFEINDRDDVMARGQMRIEFGDEARTLGLDAFELRIGSTTWELAEPSSIRFSESGALELQDTRITSAQGRITAGGSVAGSGPASFGAGVDGVDLADAARLWPDSLAIGGLLSMEAELSGTTDDPSMQGGFEVIDGTLAGVSFSSLRGTFGFRAGVMALDISMWNGQHQLFALDGTLPFDLTLPGFGVRVPERAIEMAFKGDSIPLPLVAAAIFGDQIADAAGHARTADSVLVRGSPHDVSLVGPVELVDGAMRIVSTGIAYQDLSGQVVFKGDVMELQGVSFVGTEGGRGELGGTINLSELRLPVFALKLVAEELPVYDQLDARAVISGTLALDGPYDRSVLTGSVSVVSGVLYIEEFSRRAEIVDPFEGTRGLIDAMFGRDADLIRTGSVLIDNITIDLDLDVVSDTWLRSADANIEIAGALAVQMQRAEDEMRVDGTLNAIRGDYRFFKRFEVVEGALEFVGKPAMDPNLRIIARHTVQTQKRPLDIRLIVGGTLEEPTLNLESDAQPPIPESDLLSYLIFGRPSYELTRTGGQETGLAADVLSSVPQAFMGYALGSLLVGETGIAYVDVSQAPRLGADENLAGGFAPALTATQVEVGWYLAPTVFVSVAQHLVAAVKPTVRLEWRLDERLTLLGVTEPRFGQAASLFAQGSGTDLEQSLGVFLFYAWNY